MRARYLVTALAVCSFVTVGSAQTKDAGKSKSMSMPSRDDAAATLKQDMRKLWTDHVVWTRDYIIAAVGDQPDAAAGQQLTTLLKQHISIAVDLIKAAKAGDKAAQQAADTKWHQNGAEIAAFLSKANPNWPEATLKGMMDTHLATTTDEVVARLKQDWEADVRAYDAVYSHILMMADALSDGIVKQFPEKFKAS